jgi:hypothetical protein
MKLPAIVLTFFSLAFANLYSGVYYGENDDFGQYATITYASNPSKYELIRRAQECRSAANELLSRCSEDLFYIKDLNLKKRLKTLIASCIATAAIPDPKTKLLTVFLAIVGDIVADEIVDRYDGINKAIDLVTEATSLIEQSNYYNRLSLDMSIYVDNDIFFFDAAIDNLTTADMYTTTLKYKVHGTVVSTYINAFRMMLMNEFEMYRKLVRSHEREIRILEENLDEILADASPSDKYRVWVLRNFIGQFIEFIRIAERKARVR